VDGHALIKRQIKKRLRRAELRGNQLRRHAMVGDGEKADLAAGLVDVISGPPPPGIGGAGSFGSSATMASVVTSRRASTSC